MVGGPTERHPHANDDYSRGVWTFSGPDYSSGSNGDYFAYDVLGRQTFKIQQTGAISANYTLSGAFNILTYPSGHSITNQFDQIGRLTTFTGNLGGRCKPHVFQ